MAGFSPFPLPIGERSEVLTDFSRVITYATKVAENYKAESIFLGSKKPRFIPPGVE
jgi:hypothetical protein